MRNVPRVAWGIALFVSAVFLPWWVTLLVALYPSFRFAFYAEALLAGLAIDAVYHAPVPKFFNIEFAATLAAALILLVSFTFAKRLKI
jgi:hypothetical protein